MRYIVRPQGGDTDPVTDPQLKKKQDTTNYWRCNNVQSHLLHDVLIIFKNPRVILMDVFLSPVLTSHTHRVSLRSHVCLCTRVFHVWISHHWVVEYLPHVRMKTTDVVIGGGDQTAELIPVGHKHEDALQEERICDDKRLKHSFILFLWLDSLCSRCESQSFIITCSRTLLQKIMSGSIPSCW